MAGHLAPYCFFTFGCIILWSFYRLIFGSKNFDSLTFFYFFSLFFFGIAPLVQYVQGLDLAPMYNEELTEVDFLRLNMVLIGVLVTFEIIYRLTLHYFPIRDQEDSEPCGMRSAIVALVIVGLALAVFLWYQDFNLQNVFLRGGDADQIRNDDADNKMVGLLCGKCLRYVPMSVATLYWMYGKSKLFKWLFLCVGVFCCFPLGMARLQIAPVYLPFLMVVLLWLRKMRMLMILSFVGSILFLFPLLHLFREKDIDLSGFEFFDFSFLNKLHFDSYASFAYILKEHVTTGGEQLLGSILFWFPRSLWADKPIESGRMIAETFDLGMGEFTNIAINFFAEGYLNFGMAGVFLFVVALAVVCAWADRAFWSDERNFSRPIVLYYFSWIGILIFLLRGDMMSGVAFTMGLMVAHKLAEFVLVKRNV